MSVIGAINLLVFFIGSSVVKLSKILTGIKIIFQMLLKAFSKMFKEFKFMQRIFLSSLLIWLTDAFFFVLAFN